MDMLDIMAAKQLAKTIQKGDKGNQGLKGDPGNGDLLAPDFSTSTAYKAGDYVIYDGKLYKFTAAHAAGAWDASQAEITTLAENLSEQSDEVINLKRAFEEITETTTSRNLYDKTTCNPADQCVYNSSGEYMTGQSSYATTGKILCDAQTEYTFNAGGAKIKALRYFSGESGNIFISGDTYTSPLAQTTFTTPENCTFVAVNLFANTHTTDEYNAAIDASQLELGDEATPYEPYGDATTVVPLNVVKNGDVISDFVDLIGSVTDSDVGKLVKTKTINDGKVTEWEFAVDKTDAIIEELPSKNLYDKTSCNPADGYTYNSSGEYTASELWATSGKIPVDAETRYTFSANNTVRNVRYFNGESGETFISGENTYGTFTTPALCTFVTVQLFGSSHTTEQYNAAMAVAQLEVGPTATDYEPYGIKFYVPFEHIEDGDKLSGLSEITVEQSQKNLYDKSLAVDGKCYASDGSVVTAAQYAMTGLIPVQPNTMYNISESADAPMGIVNVRFYDADKTYVENATLNGYVYSALKAFTTGTTTRYVGINLHKESHTTQDFNDTIDTLMLCYGTLRPQTYSAYNAEAVIPVEKLSNAYMVRDNFKGKTWLATGTSITWYDGKAYEVGLHQGELCRGYIGIVTSHKHLNVVNEGISGSTLGNVSDSSLINRYTSLDWAHADIATLEYGVNDLGHSIPVGTAADASGTDTFAACLKTIIEYALAQNPKIILIICTDPDVRGANTNSNGNTLKDFSDVTIAVAAQYRLPVCDWYYHSGINTLNKGDQTKDWMTVDGTHPSDAGHQRMGAMLIQTLESVID